MLLAPRTVLDHRTKSSVRGIIQDGFVDVAESVFDPLADRARQRPAALCSEIVKLVGHILFVASARPILSHGSVSSPADFVVLAPSSIV